MTWLPGLIVLAVGLAAGLLIARRLQGAKATGRDVELQLSDLETRRDDLYRRLREIDEGLAPEADREPLERAAARTLQKLELLEADLGKRHPKLARERDRDHARPAVEPAAPAKPASSPTRVFLTGFAYGVGLLLLLGGLIYWAVRDAQPRPDQAGPMSAPQGAEAPHPEFADLPPEVADRIESLTSYLATNGEDLNARKQLGYTYLGASRFVEAFDQGKEILERQPDDPDGLYLQGVVRLTMGQWQIAEELLGRALASDPAHIDSLTAAGIIRLRLGDYEQAIALWQRGSEALGGSHPMLDRLVTLAREGRSPEEILGMPAPPEAAELAAPAAPAAPAPDAITVSIDLAPGAQPTPGATLFVALRGPGGGPPSAVKRINGPSFPLTVTLSQADSMMGAPLPPSGTVSVRLDADGSASTQQPGDLAASGEAAVGGAISLLLDAG